MAVTFPVTQVNEVGPNARSVQYLISIPAGGLTTEAFCGPVDFIPGGEIGLFVSANPSTADELKLTVFGSHDGPSIAPSGRNYWVARGDMPPSSAGAGINTYLLAVTVGGMISIRGPARSYRFKVSRAAAALGAAVNLSILTVKPNR